MTPQQILRYQLALLLESHGQTRVLATLAELLKLREEELAALLAELDRLEPRRSVKGDRKNTDKTLESLAAQYPHKADLLRTLHTRLLERRFLAELRDVRRFLESHSQAPKTLKSRADSIPAVLRVLANLDLDELKSLCEQSENGSYSSLGIISDQILGRDKR